MKAEEIRHSYTENCNSIKKRLNDKGDVGEANLNARVLSCIMLGEIAAQLAELNEKFETEKEY